jgi:hypothetical protein
VRLRIECFGSKALPDLAQWAQAERDPDLRLLRREATEGAVLRRVAEHPADLAPGEEEERYAPPTTSVLLFGAGHVGRALVLALAPLPFAVRWPAGIARSGRKVSEFISFTDLTPTFLEAAGLSWDKSGLQPTSGRSLFDVFKSDGAKPLPGRDFTLIGRERNDLGRPQDQGYPVRGIVSAGLIYLENAEPSRWPACNPETGYLDTDASPTKSFILQARRTQGTDPFWELCFGMRPGRELYDLTTDADCVTNLASARPDDTERLRTKLWAELKQQGDLRALGRGAEYEAFPHSDVRRRNFYDRYMKGELLEANWVKKADFEPAPLKPAR